MYSDYEAWLISDICSTLTVSDNLNTSALDKLIELRQRGYDITRITQRLAALTGKTTEQVDKALADVIARNGGYYQQLFGAVGADYDAYSAEIAPEVELIAAQTRGMMANISNSAGFCWRGVDGRRIWAPLASVYQAALDDAIMRVQAGHSYNDAIRDTVRNLADSGIQVIEYTREQDGETKTHYNRVDVAARRAIMTATTQISGIYSAQAMEELHTDLLEVTAHAGARNIPGPMGWEDHESWQGKVYSIRTGDIYPSVYQVCGLGDVTGLCGVNCRHGYHPFVEGVSRRTYTDEDLAALKRHVTYNNNSIDQYTAHQTMRRAEARLRQLRRRMLAASASGDGDTYTRLAARYHATRAEYLDFARQTGLRSQLEDRSSVIGWGPNAERMARN